METLVLACCGNDCALCPRFLATQQGDREALMRVAALWQRVGWRQTLVTPQEIACHGCTNSAWCRYDIRQCAHGRGLANCAQCPGYPCDLLRQAWAKTATYVQLCRQRCDHQELQALERSFFLKRQRLEQARAALGLAPNS